MEIAEKNIVPLFPCVVWTHDLAAESYQPLNQELAEQINAILAPRPEIAPGHTWQTHPDLHQRPAFATLIGLFNEAVASVLEFLQVEEAAFRITGCWANVNPSGSPHSAHTHPNNYLSGVYYVQTMQGADSITFHDPREEANIIAPRVRKQTPYNAPRINVPAKDGRLVIFPAWLKHSVEVNKSPRERISISFNMMFTDFAERLSAPKWEGVGSRA